MTLRTDEPKGSSHQVLTAAPPNAHRRLILPFDAVPQRRLLVIASLGLLTFSVSESMFWGSWTAAHVGLCTLGMGAGLAGWLRWRSVHLVPTWLGWSAFAVLGAAFVFQALALPIALVVLPVLLGSAPWAMKQRPAAAAAAHLDPVAHGGHPRSGGWE